MKNINYNSIRSILLIAIVTLSLNSIAQGPPSPPGGANGSENYDSSRNGGGAPIGGGVLILIVLGAVYGGRKIYQLNKEGEETLEE